MYILACNTRYPTRIAAHRASAASPVPYALNHPYPSRVAATCDPVPTRLAARGKMRPPCAAAFAQRRASMRHGLDPARGRDHCASRTEGGRKTEGSYRTRLAALAATPRLAAFRSTRSCARTPGHRDHGQRRGGGTCARSTRRASHAHVHVVRR
ncbi:hypothetical protein B0H10DRAFT_1942145 [Mycena sp. CBHHK59/15]|nr:hypothetical protein B0H10DRAFT_1942145 [Mycena sp. CBHHK59/15]